MAIKEYRFDIMIPASGTPLSGVLVKIDGNAAEAYQSILDKWTQWNKGEGTAGDYLNYVYGDKVATNHKTPYTFVQWLTDTHTMFTKIDIRSRVFLNPINLTKENNANSD